MTIRLTKEIRINVASKLTLTAINKHALPMLQEVGALINEVKELHMAELMRIAPDISNKRYAELMQCGLLRTTDRFVVDGMHDRICVERHESDTDRCKKLFSLLMDDPTWRSVFANLGTRYWRHASSYRCYTDIILQLPAMPHYNRSGDYNSVVSKFNNMIDRLTVVMVEAVDYQGRLIEVLNACKTANQLQSLLPEAVQYLPGRPARKDLPMPVELAEQLRKQLVDGVPS